MGMDVHKESWQITAVAEGEEFFCFKAFDKYGEVWAKTSPLTFLFCPRDSSITLRDFFDG